MIRKVIAIWSLVWLAGAGTLFGAVASSPNYQIERDSLNFGGGLSDSNSYSLESTEGEVGTGDLSGTSYDANVGYQQTDDSNVDEDEDDGIVVTPPARGCTDQAAINYNPTATIDNGSCLYPVPNVRDFVAVYQPAEERVRLTWKNPDYPQFAAVRIVRGAGTVPAGPSLGTVIYDGPGEIAYDDDVTMGETYYYVAFVRSTTGAYSSGVLASLKIGEEECEDEDCEDLLAGPFFRPGETTDPLIRSLTVGDFYFVQPGGKPRALVPNGLIRVDGKKNLTVYIAYGRLPEVLKTIVVTLIDPDNPRRSFSFLLRVNEDKSRYTATIGPLIRSGQYRVIIHVLNYDDQSLRRLEGKLLVAGLSGISLEANRFVMPVTVTTGLAVGVIQAVFIATRAKNLYDIYLLLLRALGALSGFLGFRKRYRPWGTVYDAITKRPIDPAIVQVYQDGKEVSSAITDLDGRYGFFLPAGNYEIRAGKTHYRFPSQILSGKNSDVLYSNLYFGEPILTSEAEVIDRNIPLDPISFDWNEFIKNKVALFKLKTKQELIRARILNTIFAIGLATTLFAVLVTPTALNLILLGSYITIFFFQYFWQVSHRIIFVQKRSGEPVPYAIVTFWLPDLNQKIKSIVTDELGRFYALVAPGTYYVTVEEKQPDGSYQNIYRSVNMTLSKGVLNSDLVI